MARFAYQFVCLNPDCREPTELPSAIHEEILLRQNSSSTDTSFQALLCPRCKHVFVYTLQNVRLELSPNQGQYPAPSAMSFREIKLECDKPDCETPVQLIAPWLYGLEPDKTWPSQNELATWRIHGVKCPNGHGPKFPPKLVEKKP